RESDRIALRSVGPTEHTEATEQGEASRVLHHSPDQILTYRGENVRLTDVGSQLLFAHRAPFGGQLPKMAAKTLKRLRAE
ncbi:MAG: hypothetical protein ACKPB0_05435, partial [Opitutaceae bacterium]